MIVNLTVPINIEGHFVTEFEGAVEVVITNPARRSTRWGRAEPAEYQVEEYFIDCGQFVSARVGGKSSWQSNLIPAPGTLRGYIEDYAQSKNGLATIQEALDQYPER